MQEDWTWRERGDTQLCGFYSTSRASNEEMLLHIKKNKKEANSYIVQ